jgi:rubrerythrin
MSEIEDIIEAAMFQEIASQAFYVAAQNQSPEPGVETMLKDLAAEEGKHLDWLRNIRDKGIKSSGSHPDKVTDLKLSEYLTGGDKLDGAGLQDTLIFAIKRERQSMDFYDNMMSILREKGAKQLCRRLVQAELGHKYKLETLYDDLFYRED